MIIAVDFDGTCVTHEYPDVGKEIGAIPVLKELVQNGHQLLLWTCRHESGLMDAVKWFNDNEIQLWAVNKNPTQHEWSDSPKAHAHLLIDDVALGIPLISSNISKRPYVDWNEVHKILKQNGVIK